MSVVVEKPNVLWDVDENQEMIRVEEVGELRSKPLFDFIKRLFDIIASSIGLLILIIPMTIISVIVEIDSPGKPIFKQTRLGKDGKPFEIYKFRSMRIDAENDGIQWASDDDPRVTPFGRFLRKYRIDELPQLFNILIGQMSFVGPRPERPEFYDVFDTYIDGFRQRMLVKPGLTGLAQVNGGYELKPEEKIVYDMEYIRRQSCCLDAKCVLKTFYVVFFGAGAR